MDIISSPKATTSSRPTTGIQFDGIFVLYSRSPLNERLNDLPRPRRTWKCPTKGQIAHKTGLELLKMNSSKGSQAWKQLPKTPHLVAMADQSTQQPTSASQAPTGNQCSQALVATSIPLMRLPPELHLNILENCTLFSLLQLSQSNRYFRTIINGPPVCRLWKHHRDIHVERAIHSPTLRIALINRLETLAVTFPGTSRMAGQCYYVFDGPYIRFEEDTEYPDPQNWIAWESSLEGTGLNGYNLLAENEATLELLEGHYDQPECPSSRRNHIWPYTFRLETRKDWDNYKCIISAGVGFTHTVEDERELLEEIYGRNGSGCAWLEHCGWRDAMPEKEGFSKRFIDSYIRHRDVPKWSSRVGIASLPDTP
ncbi:hypothetical protein BJ508DRAFT_310887 [Ascobolus immersus RN42]|uniref:F-box domain-containing protein n=1 Tax=Ascobolus immersus RN42 TaxID=1160509 RepID=A0A3N4HSJ6_ASCIM|nr:hypothetical protein BJ508DRAFT_310887 [Ascobolus immersus RN42]